MGTLINVGLIIIGSLIGLVFKKRISEKLSESLTIVLGIAISIFALVNVLVEMIEINEGLILPKNGLILILSLTLGYLVGHLLRLDSLIDKFENHLSKRFSKNDISKGFIEATLLFCVGAMAITGALSDGMFQDSSILIAKGAMDAITSIILVSTLGIGVIFSAIPVFIYQGSLTLVGYFAVPLVSDGFMSLFSLIGFAIVFVIGLNMMKVTKVKIINLLPSLLVPIIYLILGLV